MQDCLLYLTLAAAPPSGGGGGFGSMLIPMVLFLGIMYFVLIRPQQRQKKQHEEMITKIKAGDRVKTAGGIHGKIAAVKDTTFLLEIAEKVKIEVDRGSVIAVVDSTTDEDKK